MLLVLQVPAAVAGTPAAHAAAVLCVKPGGGGGCKATIGAALAAAAAGDTIRVAAGTYVQAILIDKTLTLSGGWNGTFTSRDPSTNVTTIKAPSASAESVVTITGVIGDTGAVAPRVDGFTITGGDPGNHGGGMRITDSDATIANNTISGNIGYLFGGGVWVQRGAPTFVANTISGNHVTPGSGGYGGGIELENTQATLRNNLIADNVVDAPVGYGGGLAVEGGGPLTLVGNTVRGNQAASQAGASTDLSYGGGIWVHDARFTLKGGLIRANTASSYASDARGFGGGLYVSGSDGFIVAGANVVKNTGGYVPGSGPYLLGGGVLVESSRGSFNDVVISGNRANRNTIFGNGGGLAAVGSTLTVRRGRIRDNSVSVNCEGYGGGIYAKDGKLTLDATRLDNNCASNTAFYGLGGAVAFVNNWFTITNALLTNNYSFGNDSHVGGINADVTSPGVIVNSTFVNNRGQGIRTASTLVVRNCILVGGTTGVDATKGSADVTYSDFYNQSAYDVQGTTLDSSNLLVDPMLDATYHLTAASAAIDAGTDSLAPNHDLDGDARPLVGTSGRALFDIGADEYTGGP